MDIDSSGNIEPLEFGTQTWSNGKVLHAGPAAYSDLCLDAEQRICCLYERGETDPYETISFDQFDLGWLTGGADRLRP